MPESINLPVSIINNVLQYLGNKPYVETAQLIQSIQDAAKDQLTPPEAEVVVE